MIRQEYAPAGTIAARPQVRREADAREDARQDKRERARINWQPILLAVTILLGVVAQVTINAKISAQKKESLAITWEARELDAQAKNFSLALNQFHNLERVEIRASQLGMIKATDAQIRVVRLPAAVGETPTQSVENTGAEEMNQ